MGGTVVVPGGKTWQTTNWPALRDAYCVRYANGIFVASPNQNNATSVYSTDQGATWTTGGTMISGNGACNLAYGNGIWVGCRPNTTSACSSPDGITWTARTLPVSAWWRAMAYGAGLFVAVPDGNGVATTVYATSPDGINWTQRAFTTAGIWSAITFANGRFVVVGGGFNSDNHAAWSSDGLTWTYSTLPVSQRWQSIAYGAGLFVTTSLTSGTAYATSPDGATWTARVCTSGLWTVGYGGDKFVLLGFGNTGAQWSSDGINWNVVSKASSSIFSVDYSPASGNFVAIDFNNSTVAYLSPHG